MTDNGLKRTLESQGFLVLRNAVSHSALTVLSKVLEPVVANMESYDRSQIRSIGGIGKAEEYPELLEFLLNNETLQVVERTLGVRLTYHLGVAFLKPKAYPFPTFWHQDYFAWSEPNATLSKMTYIQIRWYLDSVDSVSGCPRVIPGSHRRCHPLHLHWQRGIQRFDGDVRGFTLALRQGLDEYAWAYEMVDEGLEIPIAPGSIMLADSRLLHGAAPNYRHDERRLLTGFYFCDFHEFSEDFKAAVRREVDTQIAPANRHVFQRHLHRLPPMAEKTSTPNEFWKHEFPSDLTLAFD